MSNYKKIYPNKIADYCKIVCDNSPSYSGIACGISKGDVYTNEEQQPKKQLSTLNLLVDFPY